MVIIFITIPFEIKDCSHNNELSHRELDLSDKLLRKRANRLGTQPALARCELQDIQDSCHL